MREQICKYCGKIFNKPHKPKQQYCSILCGRYSQIVLDNNIFETIDNVSAYVLGLIWADGNIYTPKHGRTRTLLDITSKDFQLIEQVHKILTPSKKLYSYQPKQGNRVFSIKTRDPRIINQLIAYGLCEKKSYIISWPTLELGEFKSSFIRGVFDGDGCVSTNKRNKYKYLRVSFTGCRNPFFEQLYKELQIFKPKWYNDKRTEA
ncbi:MAG: LAGLIDADG family homing endonuclease, partial [Halanaerobiales bacterium]|nr:LAGLIDADG family homing endonuclease [Halanaerobiales bacterium]